MLNYFLYFTLEPIVVIKQIFNIAPFIGLLNTNLYLIFCLIDIFLENVNAKNKKKVSNFLFHIEFLKLES